MTTHANARVEDVLDYDEVLEQFDPVLGLEVHVELSTRTKMFCGCGTGFGAEPNTQVCPVCLGLPGALPVVNASAVESAIRIGLALHCDITPWGRFARKNYFYPDMPKNFQTSQYDEPIATNGYLDVELDDGSTYRVQIERAHMEEDTGKSLHVGGSTGRIHGADYSLVDYNRAGIPLIEIVTKPLAGTGVRAPEVARAYVAALRDLLRALDVSDVRMEQGSLRCDANVSLRPKAQDPSAQDSVPLGTRTETKNVNSLRSVERAVRYEITRQGARLVAGERIVQETRHWQENDGVTTSGREKSDAEDYRYFPEPDLVPVAPDADWVEQLRGTLPEPPAERRKRLQQDWGFTDLEMRDLVNASATELVEATVAEGAAPSAARKWWSGELARRANADGVELGALPVTPADVAQLAALVEAGRINDTIARQVLEGVLAGEGSPEQVVSSRGLEVVSDDGALGAAVDRAIEANPDVAQKIRDGKVAAAGALIGAVMKEMRGQADAGRVRELVLERLSFESPRSPIQIGLRPADSKWVSKQGMRVRLRRAVMLGSGLTFALLLLGLTLTPVDPGVAVTIGAVFSGVVACVVGAIVCLKAGRGNRLLRVAAVLIGTAMMVWAAGQFLIGYASWAGAPHYPTSGDKLSLVAAPLAVCGLVLAMRPTSLRTHWLRMLADALLLSSATAMLLWRVSLHPVLASDGFGLDAYVGLVTVLVEAYLCALLLLGWLRDLDLGLGLVLLGFVLYVAADQFTMLQAVQGHAWPVVAAALWCLAWPLIGEGFITFRPAMSDDDGRSSETRVAVATTLVGFTALVGALVHIGIWPTIDPVTVALSILVVAAYALRELYGGVQRGRLLGVLTDQAMHDPLTGLGNRRAMQTGLARLAVEPSGAVLTLDLDGFKEVNDLLGHGLGDRLLVAVAGRIRDAMPTNAEAYRVGGDEFVVLVPGEQECSAAVAESLLAGVRRATESLPEADVAGVSASVGVARWSEDDDETAHDAARPKDPAERAALAILESGVALHAAKESGRDRVESYDGPVAARHRRGLDVERRLRIALAKGDLDVHYQPILSMDTGRVVSVEALARWTDPVLGRVGPDEFIAVAERSALIGELGSYVLNRAVGDVKALSDRHPNLRVAVNVSPVQLRAAAFADHVAVLVARHGLEPQRLIIEVTESLFVSDDGVGLRNLQRLRRRGIDVAIDDFGSGYSSLNYLSRLPASILKVDQVLTRSIAEDQRSLSVLRAVVELGRSLPMQVVAEGIETQEMHDIVRSFGQCLGQGWLYSAAVPLPELAERIAELDARPALTA